MHLIWFYAVMLLLWFYAVMWCYYYGHGAAKQITPGGFYIWTVFIEKAYFIAIDLRMFSYGQKCVLWLGLMAIFMVK